MPPGEAHTLWNSDRVIEIFEKYSCMEIYFCGHRHDGGFSEQNGIKYVTIPAMVESGGLNAYALVGISVAASRGDGLRPGAHQFDVIAAV